MNSRPKLAGGSSAYDAVSPSVDTTGILAKMGVVEPISMDLLPLWDDIYEGFQVHPSVTGEEGWMPPEGHIWASPYAWASIAWMYNADEFETPPDSIGNHVGSCLRWQALDLGRQDQHLRRGALSVRA